MFLTVGDLPGSFIPMPTPPKGTPLGTLTGRRGEGVGSTEGICSRERGSLGGLTQGFLTAILDLCAVKSSADASTCNGDPNLIHTISVGYDLIRHCMVKYVILETIPQLQNLLSTVLPPQSCLAQLMIQ